MKWQHRGFTSIKDAVTANTGLSEEEFLNPKGDFKIEKLTEAADMVMEFVQKKQKITIIADYDVDGVCAAAILHITLKTLGVTPVVRLPKRFSEGYGLSEKIVDEIDSGLLITVDNGITAVEAIQKAKDKGLTVLLTDHHLPREDGKIPDADIVIDPNAIPGSADFCSYCGAGIAYKLAIKLIGDSHKMSPKILSLAAIATIADVMPLVSENRLIVKKGMQAMITYSGRTTGLGALLKVCGMDTFITEKNISFKIAPILNAPGRLFDDGAQKSFELLSFNSKVEVAEQMAAELNEFNELRKEKKTLGLELIHKNIEDNCLMCDFPMCIYEPGLSEGLVGIFAGNIAEEYRVPCFVFTDSDDPEILKGSGRSYAGVHLKELLDKNASLLYKYGGHAEAAGVSVLRENFENMKAAFADSFDVIPEVDTDAIVYDIEISEKQIESTIKELDKYAPFGAGNPEIVFCIKGFMLSPGYSGYYRTMGANGQSIKFLGQSAEAVGFDMLPAYLELNEPKILDFLGVLSINYFNGNYTPQIELRDMKDAFKTAPVSPLATLLAQKAENRYK